jgi:hypothetical protein
MIGIEERDTLKGVHVVCLNYRADPEKRVPDWATRTRFDLGLSTADWNMEYENVWQVSRGVGVYSAEFERAKHVAPGPLEYMPGLPMYRGWDMGPTHISPACVVGQLDSLGRLNVLEEIVTWRGKDKPVPVDAGPFADLVNLQCSTNYPGADFEDIADPASWHKQTVVSEQKSAIDVLNTRNIWPNPGPMTFTARKEAMGTRLRATAIIISPTCTMLVQGMLGKYCYEEIGNTGTYKATVCKNAWSHPMNGLEYITGSLYVPIPAGHYSLGAPQHEPEDEEDYDDYDDRNRATPFA